jgi:hypothetical protein
MKITESVSFWIIIFSLIIALIIGSFTHWIVGVIIFVLLVGRSALIGIILDTISSSLEYHHDRQDERAKKSIASIMLLKASRSGVRPASTTMRLKKL